MLPFDCFVAQPSKYPLFEYVPETQVLAPGAWFKTFSLADRQHRQREGGLAGGSGCGSASRALSVRQEVVGEDGQRSNQPPSGEEAETSRGRDRAYNRSSHDALPEQGKEGILLFVLWQ